MRIADGSIRATRNGGNLHILRESDTWRRPVVRTVRIPATVAPVVDMARLAEACHQAMTHDRLDWLGRSLGVSCESIHRYRTGWSAQHRAYTHPMYDGIGHTVGIRLRRPDGRKYSVTGGHEGVFYACDFLPRRGETWYVVEGSSDAIAMHSIGIRAVIGRPSCTGGTAIITRMIRTHGPGRVVIVADADTPGIAGAERLAHEVMLYCCDTRIITPPSGVKDARDWITRAGATEDDITTAVSTSPRRTYSTRGIHI